MIDSQVGDFEVVVEADLGASGAADLREHRLAALVRAVYLYPGQLLPDDYEG